MDRAADSSEGGGAGLSSGSGGGGRPCLSSPGLSSRFLACSFGAGSCRTQGPNLPPDPFLPGLSCREFLWHWQASRHGGWSCGSLRRSRPKPSFLRPVLFLRYGRKKGSALIGFPEEPPVWLGLLSRAACG